MALNQNLNINLSQNLVMTPQLQMAIKMLQMNSVDLNDFVSNELMENPFLANDDGTSEGDEVDFSASDPSTQDSFEQMDSDAGLSDDNLQLDNSLDEVYETGDSVNSYSDDIASIWEKTASEEKTLSTHLTEQLGHITTDKTLLFLGAYIIDSVDDAGYLQLDIPQTAERLKVDKDLIEDALSLVQSLEPAGVGARNLKECLKLQLSATGQLSAIADEVIDNLELLATFDHSRLAKKIKCTEEDVDLVAKLIRTLNPKPGLQFASSKIDTVIPDVLIRNKQGKWEVELNPEAMPSVFVNHTAQSLLAGAKGEAKSYMTERLSRANWLMKSLEQRARTIYNVSVAIVKAQEDFFTYGVESLQPLTLKQVADIAEVHESTVSRVTTGKYMQTPLGTFELKYFFASAINTTGGNVQIASSGVKAMIKRLLDAEEPKKPLSDEKLVKLLKAEGVDIARRTVAKYREALGVPSSAKRKVRV